MVQYLYLGRVNYEEALRIQTDIAGLVAKGQLQNVLLLLEHPPVLTLGRNADRSNILVSADQLTRRGIAVHEINRGGDVTYHGPGQLVGYPIFDLRTLLNPSGSRMGPVDFVRGIEEALIRLCLSFGVQAGRIRGLTGVWCGVPEQAGAPARKIGAIGIHVARGITSHGFAFNVTTDLNDFALIIPCGIPDHAVTSLEKEIHPPDTVHSLESIAHQAARNFGQVFGEQVQPFESLDALQAQAAACPSPSAQEIRQQPPPEFPAEDTPLQIPPEVDRLGGKPDRPIRV